MNSSSISRGGGWWGYPKAAWLVIGVEASERFSFYGVLSLLVLFLTGSTAHGGFGWTAADALTLLGAYSGAMYAFPALGGYVADRVLGRRRAVGLGLGFTLLGQILLLSPVFLPALCAALHKAPLLESLRTLGAPLGYLRPPPAVAAAIEHAGATLDAAHGVSWLRDAYALGAAGFYAAMFFLVLGNALMKASLVVLCGDTFPPDDVRRESAYAYYYLGIALGAVTAGIVVGGVAELFGWYCGFMTGLAGILIACSAYAVLARRWLPIDVRADSPVRQASIPQPGTLIPPQEDSRPMQRIGLLGILALLLCIFSTGWFQLFGTWSLFIGTFVKRSWGTFVIPVPWFGSLDAAAAIVFAPLLAEIWVRLAVRETAIDIVQKYVFAFAMAALAHLLMFLCARGATASAPGSVWLPTVAVILLAVGELVAWTSTYAVVSRAAPIGLASMTMGLWYMLTLGLGGYFSGFAGHVVTALGFADTFGVVALAMGAAALGTLSLRRTIFRMAGRAGIGL